jgi:hypothetical protein
VRLDPSAHLIRVRVCLLNPGVTVAEFTDTNDLIDGISFVSSSTFHHLPHLSFFPSTTMGLCAWQGGLWLGNGHAGACWWGPREGSWREGGREGGEHVHCCLGGHEIVRSCGGKGREEGGYDIRVSEKKITYNNL